MASIFSRKRNAANRHTAPENRQEQRHDVARPPGAVQAYLPASARPYEAQRLLVAYGNDDSDSEGPDEDIEFLASLVEEIDRAPLDTVAANPRTRAEAADLPARADTGATELRARPARPAQQPVAAAAITMRVASDDDTNLNVFRASRSETERVHTSQQLGVGDVELDDLLEDLSTTAAAIQRRRKAA